MATRQPISLQVRYILALGFIAVLSLGSYFAVRSVISSQQGDAAVVNVSGRQRMLSQRIGLFANQYVATQSPVERQNAREELEAALDLFEVSHEALLIGGTVAGFRGSSPIEVLPQTSESLQDIYFGETDLDRQVRDYILAGRALLAANEGTLSLNQPSLQYIQEEGPNRLLDGLNTAVSAYQAENEADIFSLEVRSGTNLVIIWAVLLIMGFFIFRPMDVAIKKNTRELEEQNSILGTRNKKIEEQTKDLELAFRVSHVMGRINDLGVMLQEAVNLLQERFGLYYAQVYLADGWQRTILLRAGSGDVGQRLAERGHRLPIGPGSINGRAAVERQMIVVPNTAASNSFRPNPLLPLTRSELSVPLMVEGNLLGVLNLQSDQINGLNEARSSVFEALASQLAVAIDNAITYAELVGEQKELVERNRETQEALWEGFFDGIRQRQRISYIHEDNQLNESTELLPSLNTLISDIAVDNVKIGEIQLSKDGFDDEWSDEEQVLIDGVAEQVGRHIDNLRLLAQTERYRNEAELVTKRMTQRNWQELLSDDALTVGYQYDRNEVRALTAVSHAEGTQKPLQVNGETIGYLATDEPLVNEDAELILSSVANQLSAHLENLRLAKQTEDALADTERLYRAGRALTEASSPKQLLDGIITAVQSSSPVVSAAIFSTHLDENNVPTAIEQLSFWTSTGNYPIPDGTVFQLENFSTAALWRTGNSVLVEDMEQDERIDEATKAVYRQVGASSFGILPLRVGAEWVGVLTVNWPEVQRFEPEQYQFFDALMRQAAVVLNNQFLLAQTQDALEETATQAERLRALNGFGSKLSEALTLDDVLTVLSEEIGNVIALDRLSLALSTGENGKMLDLYTLTESNSGHWPKIKMPAEGTYLGRSMSTNEVLVENDMSTLTLPDIEPIKKMGIQSGLVGPLVINNQSIGTINVSSMAKDAFDEQDVNIMLQLASLVSATIQSIRSLEESRNRARELALVNEIGQVVSLINDAESIFEAVLMQLQQTISVDAFMVGIFDYKSELMNFAYTYDEGERFEPYFDTLSSGSRMRQVLETGEPIFISRSFEEAQAERENALQTGTSFGQVQKMSASLMYVPLQIGDVIAGCMTVQSYEFGAYSRSDLALLMGVATYIAIALEKVDLIQSIQKRAQRERLINEISSKIQQAVTIEGALQTAVRELGITFQAEQTQVALTRHANGTNGNAINGSGID